MPRVLQPGGGGGKMRVRYTVRRKRSLVATSKRMIVEGMTLRAAAEELRVSVANLSRWTLQGMGEIYRLEKILRSKKRAAHTGPSGQLKAIEDELLRYIFKQREQRVEIKVFTVALRASFLSPEFREKSFTARCSCVKRFMRAHSCAYLMGTHTSQRPPAEVEGEASDFMRFAHVIVSGANRDRCFILNVDQTPVYFSMSSKKTYEVIGKKTIHIRMSTNDTFCFPDALGGSDGEGLLCPTRCARHCHGCHHTCGRSAVCCHRVCHRGPEPPILLVVAADVGVRHCSRLCSRLCEELCW